MTPLRIRLRELRQAAGLSQEALAERVGVRQATISDLENRDRPRRIDVELLERLAETLGCRSIDLIVDETPAKRRRG